MIVPYTNYIGLKVLYNFDVEYMKTISNIKI